MRGNKSHPNDSVDTPENQSKSRKIHSSVVLLVSFELRCTGVADRKTANIDRGGAWLLALSEHFGAVDQAWSAEH